MHNKPGILLVMFISVFLVSLILSYAFPDINGILRTIILAGTASLSAFCAIRFFNKRHHST